MALVALAQAANLDLFAHVPSIDRVTARPGRSVRSSAVHRLADARCLPPVAGSRRPAAYAYALRGGDHP
jgi:hypothetical protein